MPTLYNMVYKLATSGVCVCKKCGCRMVGYPGDDECSDCWIGFDRAKFNANFEGSYFQRTGERKTTGGILGIK